MVFCLLAYFFNGLTLLFLQLISRIANRNQDGSFLILTQSKRLLAQFSIKVTYPTCTKSLFRSSQTKMLNCNGYVNIAMMLAIGSNPLFVMQDRGNDNNRSRSKPFTVVALADFLPVLPTTDYTEHPRLLIDSGGSKPNTLHDIVQFFLFNTRRLIVPTAISSLYQF